MMMRFLILVSVILAVSACKVRIIVPPEGTVASQSGAYFCAAGATCDIEVNDVFFNEKFIATPADGYDFVEWKEQKGGLCLGVTGSCDLSTAFLAGKPKLMAILESDRVFTIEPVFAEALTSDGSAANCFNARRWSKGARLEARYRGPDGTVVRIDEKIGRLSEYNEFPATKIVRDAVSDNPPTSWRNEQYTSIDKGRRRLNTRGIITESFTPEAYTQIMKYLPGRLFRYDLAAGQSYSSDHLVETLIDADDVDLPEIPDDLPPGFELPPGLPDPDADFFSDISEWDRRITYVGRQTIDVPAGTFETCRFEIQNEVTAAGVVDRFLEITWIGVDNGVMIRDSNDGNLTVLLSGRLNGVALKGL
jgi:hypothetical protein